MTPSHHLTHVDRSRHRELVWTTLIFKSSHFRHGGLNTKKNGEQYPDMFLLVIGDDDDDEEVVVLGSVLPPSQC